MEGIVIKSIDYKEKSKLVYLYTPAGIEGVKALDATRTKLGFTTTLNWVEYQKSSAKLPTVLEYQIKKSYYDFYTDIQKIGALMPMLDLLHHLEEDAPHARIFPFFQSCLDALMETEEPRCILSLFLIKMLAVFGVRPMLKSCVRCQGKSLVSFSVLEGGALCQACAKESHQGMMLYQAFHYFYTTQDYGRLPEFEVEYDRLLDAVYQYYLLHANLQLKSYKLK